MITIFGDSITAARFSFPYKDLFKNKEGFLCRGINGQDSLQVCFRALNFAKTKENQEIIIQAGNNDVLDICKKWSLIGERKPQNASWEQFQDWGLKDSVRSHVEIFLSGEGFEAILEPVLNREAEFEAKLLELKQVAKLSVCSTVLLTEKLDSIFNRLAREWNIRIKEFCKKNEITFIDLYSSLAPLASGDGLWLGGSLNDLIEDSKKKGLSEERGLKVTVDGIHLNEAGAAKVASLIEAN